MEEFDEDEEQGADSEGDKVPLHGVQLGGIAAEDEESEELARSRFKAIPRILFEIEGPSSKPIQNPQPQGRQGQQVTPPPLPTKSSRKKKTSVTLGTILPM
jgi:hypothetical protein